MQRISLRSAACFWGGLAAVVTAVATKREELAGIVLAVSQVATGIVMVGHSRQYEAESDAFANIYLSTIERNSSNQPFAKVLRKLQYHQDYFDPEGKGSSFLSSHPHIEGRIDAVENSRMSVFDKHATFFGYDKQGDLVATVSFQGQRVYTRRLNKDDVGLQLISLVETTSGLEDKDKIKEIKIFSGDKEYKFDNKEDTEVLPNDAVGASFVKKDARILLESIDRIELDLKNVNRWVAEE